MPLFSRRPRKSSRSRSPPVSRSATSMGSGGSLSNSSKRGVSISNSADTPLRSRGGTAGRNSSMVLPVTRADVVHNKSNRAIISATSNNFLLGGMYVPGKDRRRRVPRRRSHHRGGSFRFRCSGKLVDLWQRLFYTSPGTAIATAILIIYVLIFYVLVPVVTILFTSGGWPSHKRGIDWLLTDTTLQIPQLSVKELRAKAEQFAIQQEIVRKGDRETRLGMLESLASSWYHRNDAPKPAKDQQQQRQKQEPSTLADKAPLKKREKKGGKRPVKRDGRNNVDKKKKSEIAQQDDLSTIKKKSQKLQDSDHIQKRLFRTLQTMDIISNNSKCPADLDESRIQTTLVVQTSLDRVWILDETCARWKDPIVVVVALGKDDNHMEAAQNLAGWRDKCPQMEMIVDDLDKDTEATPEQYPVNVLRNMALDAVQTSHILVVDVDFVPSDKLDETIRSVLLEQQQSKVGAAAAQREAIVVPAFQRVLDPPCTSDKECARHLRRDSSFIPHKFEDLQKCYKEKECIVFQDDVNWPGHSSTRSDEWLKRQWYEEKEENSNGAAVAHQSIRSIHCFESLRYEPYVVIRWCPTATEAAAATHPPRQLDYENASDTQNNRNHNLEPLVRPVAPYYDERFHGYGKNKIQHISHLRLLGYKFRVLPEGFIVHNPHVESKVKETWNNVAESNLHREMDKLYKDFLHELIEKYYDKHGEEMVNQCKD